MVLNPYRGCYYTIYHTLCTLLHYSIALNFLKLQWYNVTNMKIEKIMKLNKKQLNELSEKSEHTIQCDCVNWFRKEYKDYIIHSTPNEATRNNTRYKQSGVLSGVADLTVKINNSIFIDIEVKDHKGRQSKNQINIQKKLEKINSNYIVVKSLDEFKNKVKTLINSYN